jgi:hypothetical protein
MHLCTYYFIFLSASHEACVMKSQKSNAARQCQQVADPWSNKHRIYIYIYTILLLNVCNNFHRMEIPY